MWSSVDIGRAVRRGNGGMGQDETFVRYGEWRIVQANRQNKEMVRILTGGRKLHDDMEVLARGRRENIPTIRCKGNLIHCSLRSLYISQLHVKFRRRNG
jgi:hypothetical protein